MILGAKWCRLWVLEMLCSKCYLEKNIANPWVIQSYHECRGLHVRHCQRQIHSSKISKKKNTNSSQMCKVTLFGCATSTELWASKYITRCHILHVASLKTPEFPLVPAQYAAGQVAYSRIRWWSTNRRILVEWLGDEIQQVFGITVVTWNVMKKRVMFIYTPVHCVWCCFVYIWGGGLRQRRTCSKGHNTQLRLVTGVCSNWLAPTLMLSWIIPA